MTATPTPASWPGRTATAGDSAGRIGLTYKFADLIHRFAAEQDTAGKWRVRDKKAGEYSPAEYASQPLAEAAARLAAAGAIVDAIREPEPSK